MTPTAQLALPAASAGCTIVYRATSYTRRRGHIPPRPIQVNRSATVRDVLPSGVFDVATPNGLAFVSPLAIVKVKAPEVES